MVASNTSLLCLVLFFTFTEVTIGKTGYFWHISDHHLDPYYTKDAQPSEVCPSSYGKPTIDAGPLGDYKCDSPWALIKSSVDAMQILKSDPDFIVWTGDDTMHTADQDKYLGSEKVLEIIGNVTNIIKEVFPNTTVYPALGNHDFHPKSQIAPGGSELLTAIAELWKDWLSPEAYQMFQKDGYYTETFGPQNDHVMLVLNSNFWYENNKNVDGTGDPAGEFQWMENILTQAKADNQKVFIVGHVPPGYFELLSNGTKRWFYPEYLERFLNIIRLTYNPAIAGMFFGHHHSDHFKIIKDTDGNPIASVLLAPGVTPWATTLPGVVNGSNNPGIRLFEYDRDTLELMDYTQYFLDLSSANKESQEEPANLWEFEYSAKEKYNLPDISTTSWAKLANEMRESCEQNSSQCSKSFEDYFLMNSVSYNHGPCNESCQKYQLCAITEVSVGGYKDCQMNWGNFGRQPNSSITTLLLPIVFWIIFH